MAKKITEDGEIIDLVTYEVIAMAPPFWKTPHNHDRDKESLAHGTACLDPSKTQQQFLKDADINTILAKFTQTGELPITGQATYGDADDRDLQDRIVTAWEVNEAWEKLSPEVRNTLRDPQLFVEYVEHCLKTGDVEPLQKLGLAPPPEPPKTDPEPPKPPAPPVGGSPAPTPAAGAPTSP